MDTCQVESALSARARTGVGKEISNPRMKRRWMK
jgi:hypothetical protein